MSKSVYVSLPLAHVLAVTKGRGDQSHLYSAVVDIANIEGDILYSRDYYYDNESDYDAFIDGVTALAYNLGLSVHYEDEDEECQSVTD